MVNNSYSVIYATQQGVLCFVDCASRYNCVKKTNLMHNLFLVRIYIYIYMGADKSLVWPGRKQARATEDFDVHIYYNWRNISTIYIYNKTSIKRNILTIKQNTSGSRSGYGLISTQIY